MACTGNLIVDINKRPDQPSLRICQSTHLIALDACVLCELLNKSLRSLRAKERRGKSLIARRITARSVSTMTRYFMLTSPVGVSTRLQSMGKF